MAKCTPFDKCGLSKPIWIKDHIGFIVFSFLTLSNQKVTLYTAPSGKNIDNHRNQTIKLKFSLQPFILEEIAVLILILSYLTLTESICLNRHLGTSEDKWITKKQKRCLISRKNELNSKLYAKSYAWLS